MYTITVRMANIVSDRVASMSNLSRERLHVKDGHKGAGGEGVRGKVPDMQPTGWGTARHTAACPNILELFSVFRAIVETRGKGVSYHFITEALDLMEVKKILCAVDLEDTIAPSVEYAKMMASMTGASILVAYVIPAHTPYEDVYLSVNNQPNEVNNPNETIQKSMNALFGGTVRRDGCHGRHSCGAAFRESW